MKRQSFIMALLCLLFSSSTLLSQVQCFRTCAPNPGSATYGGNLSAAFQPRNARGPGRPTIPGVRVGNSTAVLGSSSYSYAVPVLHLPGRAGLDLDLTLYYNSDVWTLDSSNNSLTFNADHDWPSYGFRLDFGLLESNSSGYFLIEADGTKHSFTSAGSGLYNSTDSTYINLSVVGSTYTITYKNGMQVVYEPFPSTQPGQAVNLFRPNRINDTNGNFISITYVASTDQQINTVTDTVNRVVQFNYNANGYLTSITSNSGAITWTSFSWNTAYTLGYNFSATVQDSPANGATLNVLSGITLPNSTSYSFTYGSWGIVNQITNLSSTAQSRGYQSYDYPGTGTALSAPPTYTQQTVSDGTTTRPWTYSTVISNNLVSQTNIASPGGGVSTVNLYTTAGDWRDGLVSSTQSKDSGGHVLRETDNTWTADAGTNANPRISSLLNILSDTGQQSRTDFGYDANGCVTDKKEYDYGLVLKREIVTQYSSAYTSAHILNLPTQIIIKNAGGANISRTDFNYSDVVNSPAITGAANHNDSYSGSRGNLISITRYTDPVGGTGAITRNFHYDSLGNLATADLDCCSQKQWNFSSNTQYAYPDSVVSGPSSGPQLTKLATYNNQTGTVATTTDENLKVTQFSYDSSNRIHTVTQPDTVVITSNYDDAATSPSTSVSNSANSAVQKTVVDGLRRTIQSQLLNGATVLSSSDTQYDDLNRQIKNSNPYLPGTETPVWTTTQFDEIGRPTSTTPPSGGTIQYQYSGNITTVTDPATKPKRNIVDYAGHLVEVDEPLPTSTTLATSGAGSITVTGSLQSSTTSGTKATGWFTVSGSDDFVVDCGPSGECGPHPPKTWDSGWINVVINGAAAATGYGQNSNASTMASSLVSQLNPNPVTYSDPGTGTITVTADTPGPNYSLSGSVQSNDVADFGAGSFSVAVSGPTLTGGVYPVTTYDSGTLTVTVNGFQASASYNQNLNNTASALTSALVSALNASGSPVVASVSGTTITLTAKNSGSATNYTVSGSSTASFTVSSSALTGAQDQLSTFYSYDPIGNLTTVNQGSQTRTYHYDALGRMTSSVLPENGTTSFTYTDYGAVNTRTDARGVITTYVHDGLHRLTSMSYNVGSTGVPATPSLAFTYGTSTSSNNNGRLLSMTDGPGSETYTYDVMGRLTQVSRVISGTTYNIGYGYNSAGELNSLTYPSNRVVSPGYDAVGRMTQISSGGTNYLSSMAYNSAQLPTAFTYGNGVQASFGYNDHLQPASLSYTSGATALLNLSYNYLDSNGHNNGQIQSITDSRGTAFSTSYSYDSLGRLQQAQTNDLTAANTWRLVWDYDRYGNRLSQTLTGGTMAVGQPQLTFDATTNHITTTGFVYDANGNLTHDTAGAYTFDADNHMTQSVIGSTTATYSYDGHRWRVQKTAGGTTTTYIYAGSKVIAEYVGGSLSREYIYSGSKLLATVAGTSVTYHHPDHLSNRVETNSSGSTTRTFGQLPFGETWYETGTADKWKFTTYERDSESGLDYAMHRYYNSGFGRFHTPDLLPGNPLNPQSLNRYSYVANDPINMVDPLGLFLIMINSVYMCDLAPDGKTVSNCHLVSVDIEELGDGDSGNSGGGGNGGGGGGNGGKKPPPIVPNVNLKALGDCIANIFGVLTLQFTPSQEASAGAAKDVNGSFTGISPLTGPFNVENNVTTYSYADITDMARKDGTLPPEQGGIGIGAAHAFTNKAAPYLNWTGSGNLVAQDVLESQIFELGNSLSAIVGTHPAPKDETDANALLDCYKNGGPSKK